MDFGVGIFRIEIDFDSWFWYPYILQGKYDTPEMAKYYGHTWFVIIYLWILEIIILRQWRGEKCVRE